MTERLIAKLERLGAEAGIKEMTIEIFQFASGVRADLAAEHKKPWAGLTDGELMKCTVFKHFDYDPPYIDKDGAKHVGSDEVSLRATYENINAKLKEKNA